MDMNNNDSFFTGLFLGAALFFGGLSAYLYENPVERVEYRDKYILVPVPKFIVPNTPGVAPILPESN